MLRDLRYACRHLLLNRGITVAAVFSLAVGIGAVATTFGWLDQMMLRPLPGVRDAGNLFILLSRNTAGAPGTVSHPDYVDIRTGLDSVATAAATQFTPLTLTTRRGGLAERVFAELVSDNYFQTLGVRSALGRVFQGPEASVPGSHPVAVLSDGFWRQRFQSDPNVLGRTLFLNDQAFTIVGVTSQEFRGGFVATDTHLWIPLMMQGTLVSPPNLLTARERRWLQGLVRLRSGRKPPELLSRMGAISQRLTTEYSSIQRGRTFFVTPIWQSPIGIQPLLRPVLLPLTGLSALLLILACANVANLLLARAMGRRRDLAIRLALGSGQRRAVRQFFVEGLLLSAAAGVGGLVVTRWAIGLLRLFQPPTPFPAGIDTDVDRAVVQITVLVVLFVGSLITLIPIVQLLRSSPMTTLRTDSEFITAGRGRRRLNDVLTALQIGVSLAVLIGGGLSVRSLDRARRVTLGFDPENVLLTTYDLSAAKYKEEAGIALHRRLFQEMSSIPGVSSASVASTVPFGLTGRGSVSIDVEGYVPRPSEDMSVRSNFVGPRYFRTMAIPLVRGREFEERDDKRMPLVAIVSHAFANRYWPNSDPLGKHIRFPTGERLEIVGVSGDVRFDRQQVEPPLVIYAPLLQWYRPDATVHIRTATPGSVVQDMRQRFLNTDASVPFFNVTTLADQVESSTFFQQFAASLSLVLVVICLGLTAVGVHSMLAYAVAERRTEISLRVALGAQRRDIIGMILRHALFVTATGLGIGMFGGLIMAFLLENMLVGVPPMDGPTWAVGILAVAVVVIAASTIAATRAAAIGPIAALRRSVEA